jgi:von Willebrand factor type A domain
MSNQTNYINHICFLLDASGSMQGQESNLIATFDKQIQKLKKQSNQSGQETKVSIYQFNDKCECVCFETDVNRVKSLLGAYRAVGNTAVIDSTMLAIRELKQIPQNHGDHSFMVFVVTDGESNSDKRFGHSDLSYAIKQLEDNWTFAILVPNASSVFHAKKCGFPAGNIQVWDATSKKGIKDGGEVISQATSSYYRARSSGIRSTRSLFNLASNITSKVVKSKLNEIDPNDYEVLLVRKDAVIKPFVESWRKSPYRVGSSYYQLVKEEVIQASKMICIEDKYTGKLYTGTQARELLGLPNFDVKVNPLDHDKFNIFCQSTSVNRKLPAGTKLVVFK